MEDEQEVIPGNTNRGLRQINVSIIIQHCHSPDKKIMLLFQGLACIAYCFCYYNVISAIKWIEFNSLHHYCLFHFSE
jgi:hypothetical protein